AGLLQRPHHGIERVRDADDERIRAVLLDARAYLLHDLEVDAEQVIAAHAGLPRHARGDDHHVGTRDVGIGTRALDRRIEALDRTRLHEIEPFAGRNAFRNVEQHDVAELLESDKV